MRARIFPIAAGILVAILFSGASAADLSTIPEACVLLTNQDVQKIAEEELGEPEADKTDQSEHVKLSGCTYVSADGDKSLSLVLRASDPGDNDPVAMIRAMKEGDSSIEDVTGVGDVAIWKPPSHLQAFKGKDIQVLINVINFSSPKDKAIAMGKLAFEKLASAGKAEMEK